jgi:cytoskeletal protein CcmA (bactofilin family)
MVPRAVVGAATGVDGGRESTLRHDPALKCGRRPSWRHAPHATGLILVVMWPFVRSGIPVYEVDNIVGEGTTVRGDVRGPGGVRVDGMVVGSIEADGPVVIGEKGAVEGSVSGRDVVVLGRVHGNISAKNHLEIGPQGRVMGDVDVVSVKVHSGAVFHGASRIGDAGGAPRLATNTNPIGILPVSNPPPPVSHKAKSGRTLPPPLGAVPPPPTTVGSQPKIPVVAPAASTIERIGSRDGGRETRESGETTKAAAND